MRATFRTIASTILFTAAAAGAAGVACSTNGDSPAANADAGPDSTAPGDDSGAVDGNGQAVVDGAGTTDAPGDDAANPGDDASGNPGSDSGGDSGSDSGGDAGDDSGASPLLGAIFATSDSYRGADGGTQLDYSGGGFFVNQSAPDPTLATTTTGPCVVEIDGSGSATEASESAGTVSITGGKKTITLPPTAAKDYVRVQGTDSNLWNGGETIVVTAAGADVPAFTTSIVAPSKITLTTPAVPPLSGALNVPRNAAWSATWTGASSGNVVFYFSDTDQNHSYTATCKFAASAGTATVPAAAFASFPAGSGSFNFYVETASTAAVPGWNIHFNASSAVVDGAGTQAIGSTTYP